MVQTSGSLRVQGTEAPVSTGTLLNIARNVVEIPELPAMAQLMIPQVLSFTGLDLRSDLNNIDGFFSLQWPNGKLQSKVASSLAEATASLSEINFSHQLIGELQEMPSSAQHKSAVIGIASASPQARCPPLPSC